MVPVLAWDEKIKVLNFKPIVTPLLWVGTRRSLLKFEVAVTSGDRATSCQSFDLVVNGGQKVRSPDRPQMKILL